MSPKKIKKKRDIGLKNIRSIVPKDFDLTKINPFNFVENTKNKLENYYANLKKKKEKENNRLEKQRKLDQKREEQRQKKQAQKERLDKIKE